MSWIGSPIIPFEDIGMTQEKWDLLESLSMQGGYWRRAFLFIRGATNRRLSSLSLRQRNWLTEIVYSLDIELERKAWRIKDA